MASDGLKTQSGSLLSTGSGHGKPLLAKRLTFAGMIAIGLEITLAVMLRLGAPAPAPGSPPPAALLSADERLEVLAAANTPQGMAVLILAVVL